MGIAPLGILGGTFDPIHNGHLRLAQEALEQCSLRGVRFIPGGTPPHRTAPRASAHDRLHMVRLALADNPAFELDTREIHRIDPCYTIDTLTSLRAELGSEQPLCLLMGSDAFLQLHTWRQWENLFDLAHIVVMQRASTPPLGNRMTSADPELYRVYCARLAPAPQVLHESPHGALLVINMPALEISATQIRGHCASGRSIRYLLPDAVASLIQTHNLYTHAEP